MTYGLGNRAPAEFDLAAPPSSRSPNRSPIRSWRALSEACRFELIEQALSAANDRIDGYPIAL